MRVFKAKLTEIVCLEHKCLLISLKKGNIYNEYPSDFVIDDSGKKRIIGTNYFKSLFEELNQ